MFPRTRGSQLFEKDVNRFSDHVQQTHWFAIDFGNRAAEQGISGQRRHADFNAVIISWMHHTLCRYLETRKESARGSCIARAQRRPQRHRFAATQYDHRSRDGKLKAMNRFCSAFAEATYRTSPSLDGLARTRRNVCPARFLQATALVPRKLTDSLYSTGRHHFEERQLYREHLERLSDRSWLEVASSAQSASRRKGFSIVRVPNFWPCWRSSLNKS